MKRNALRIVVVVTTGIMFGGCNTAYSEDYSKSLRLTYDTGRVTKIDKVNDFVYLDTNHKKGPDVIIDGALGKDSSLRKGDFIFYGYDSSKKVDTLKKIRN
ncbi:MAG: hypothetical protein KBC44_02535 [Candidatus Pacebacteria bacterium]|nr:hypothetical protein [Candidatus Paceibacterota bacterium]